MIFGGAVSWKSKKQSAVSTSSVEAEYMALSTASQECVWLKNVYSFAKGIKDIPPVILHADNQGSIKMAKNDASGKRNKHIDIRYHLIRDLLHNRQLTVEYCPTDKMLADGLTKPLQRVLFEKFVCSIGLREM